MSEIKKLSKKQILEEQKQIRLPKKCTPKLLREAKKYIKNYDSEHEHVIPTIAGLAIVLKISRRTIQRWVKAEVEPMCRVIEDLKAKQKVVTLAGGLSGKLNPSIAKLVLSQHGMIEKKEVDQSVDVKIEVVKF